MTGVEIQRWQVLYSLEPWGEHRLEILFAQACHTIANFAQISVEKKHRHSFHLSDFLFKWWDTPEDIRQAQGQKVFDSFKAAVSHLPSKEKHAS